MATRVPRNGGAPAPDMTDQMGTPPPAQGGYYQQQPPAGYYPDQGGNGLHDAAQAARRSVRTPETKAFYRTSEFLLWFVMTAAVLIASALNDTFDAEQVWPAVMFLTSAYILSRGIAKSGSRRGEPEARGTY